MAAPNSCKATENPACGLCCTKINNFAVNLADTVILQDVNLHIHCGELTAIIGPNGAGKSTLLKAILGEIPHQGELRFLDAANRSTSAPLVGYVPQHLDFDPGAPISVMDLFGASTSRWPVCWSHRQAQRLNCQTALKRVQASHLLDRRLGKLSGGELQRVLLALALTPIPDLLLLDEPVSGVDQRGMEIFYEMVSDLRHRYDLSIILVSHDLNLMARYADRIVYLNKTVICSGTPAEVFNNDQVIKEFGKIELCPLDVDHSGKGD
ncbi:ABC transporter-like [Syntrophomonas zehnderi OL-4]|uniref:ABC transporter-like n=1 Tax=Syntrophomonas zehnderi OL-4 TaxID=690567 RepID=A0A0E4GAA9_9FIRM|nr:metal ABC transporter ATP-binding protein [Syntrophomonas zehnderi]CFX27457.1 ABC transporter-like [Syntrophomonas zehnderi OL-4]